MPHVPDTVPGKRVTGAGARTEGREASRQTSEVGAVCGQAARTVLCGGRSVMGVPTAIRNPCNPCIIAIPVTVIQQSPGPGRSARKIAAKGCQIGGSVKNGLDQYAFVFADADPNRRLAYRDPGESRNL